MQLPSCFRIRQKWAGLYTVSANLAEYFNQDSWDEKPCRRILHFYLEQGVRFAGQANFCQGRRLGWIHGIILRPSLFGDQVQTKGVDGRELQ